MRPLVPGPGPAGAAISRLLVTGPRPRDSAASRRAVNLSRADRAVSRGHHTHLGAFQSLAHVLAGRRCRWGGPKRVCPRHSGLVPAVWAPRGPAAVPPGQAASQGCQTPLTPGGTQKVSPHRWGVAGGCACTLLHPGVPALPSVQRGFFLVVLGGRGGRQEGLPTNTCVLCRQDPKHGPSYVGLSPALPPPTLPRPPPPSGCLVLLGGPGRGGTGPSSAATRKGACTKAQSPPTPREEGAAP